MRDIKFRAWNMKKRYMDDGSNSFIFDCYDMYPECIMQFTCLTDKNDKEIYDGDIVEMNCLGWGGPYKELACVVWTDYRWGFQMLKKDSTGHVRLEWLENKWQREIEVIGNIYENATLLEEKSE